MVEAAHFTSSSPSPFPHVMPQLGNFIFHWPHNPSLLSHPYRSLGQQSPLKECKVEETEEQPQWDYRGHVKASWQSRAQLPSPSARDKSGGVMTDSSVLCPDTSVRSEKIFSESQLPAAQQLTDREPAERKNEGLGGRGCSGYRDK